MLCTVGNSLLHIYYRQPHPAHNVTPSTHLMANKTNPPPPPYQATNTGANLSSNQPPLPSLPPLTSNPAYGVSSTPPPACPKNERTYEQLDEYEEMLPNPSTENTERLGYYYLLRKFIGYYYFIRKFIRLSILLLFTAMKTHMTMYRSRRRMNMSRDLRGHFNSLVMHFYLLCCMCTE